MVPEQVIAGDPFIIMKKTKIKQVKYIKNIENLTAHNKKKITKKDEHTPLKQT